jgi:hypothetical protein
MDSLLEQFGDLTIAGATVAHRNPYLGPNDPAPDSVVINLDMTQPGAWEKVCNLRWPHAPEFEKQVLETRFGQALTWEKMPALLDEYMQKWGKDQYFCHPVPFGLSRIRHRNKGRSRQLSELTIRSLAVSQYYATALVTNDHTNLSSGSIWSFPVIHFENTLKAEWTNSGIQLAAYQVSYILETTLYVVDGAQLVCIDLAEKRELYRIDMYEKFKILLFNCDFVCASMTGFVLTVSKKNGFALFYENKETMSVDLIEHKLAPVQTEEEAKRDLGRGQNPGELTVVKVPITYTTGSIDFEKMVLGRSDGKVEMWPLQQKEENGKKSVVTFGSEIVDFFVDQTSDHNMRPLKMVSGDPITGIYSRGRRMVVYSRNNRVSMEMLQGCPITMLDENKDMPIVAMSVFGDFTAVLYANAAMEIGRFAGTKPVYVHTAVQTNLERTNFINIGEQRIATLADMVIVLSQNGVMYSLSLNNLKK